MAVSFQLYRLHGRLSGSLCTADLVTKDLAEGDLNVWAEAGARSSAGKNLAASLGVRQALS